MFNTKLIVDFDGKTYMEIIWEDFIPKNTLSQICGESKSRGWWTAGKLKLRNLGRKTVLLVDKNILNEFTFLCLTVLKRDKNREEFSRYYQKQLSMF